MPSVPSRSWYDPVLDAVLHTGADAVEHLLACPEGQLLATDIETPGLDRAFTVNCVTLAWWDAGRVHAALLDPARVDAHASVLRDTYRRARAIVLHNAPFDIPALYHHGWLRREDIDKIIDTLLLARFAYPDTMTRKDLTTLSGVHLGLADFAEGIALAFKAAGHRTLAAGYAHMDIDAPVYALGAMADTVATLRLEPILRAAGIALTLDHPFSHYGACDAAAAHAVLTTQETVHRVMLARTALGISVDADYLTTYLDRVEDDRQRHITALARVGLDGGSGKGAALVEHLHRIGELPAAWPRTPTGKLKATKDLLDALDHPLALAQRHLAESDKVTGYLDKVARQAAVTGRCHPQVGVLGASSTGRWSAAYPEYQQFPAAARPIFTSDGTPGRALWSIDWSQIEPIMLANMAGGTDMIVESYEAGNDLYEPLMRSAGIDRTLAKTMLLATMYGQGIPALSRRINHTEESAAQIRRQMLAAMPAASRFMVKIQTIAEQYGRVITVGSRILPVDAGGVFRSVNYVIQGSAACQLDWAVESLHRAGLSDRIVLGLHDELVVDAYPDEAADIERIMRQPHPNLTLWTKGRTPILRCDRELLGHAWKKV